MRDRLTEAGGALRAALGDRRLRRIQLSWGGTITAEWVIIVALGVWAFDAGGALGVGLMTLARTIPAGVVAPFLAPLADRWRRDRVLGGVTAVRALLVAAVAAALFGGAPAALVYVLAAVDAAVFTLYWPAQSSLLAELARRPEELVAANVTSTTLENVGGLGGPVLAAAVLAVATTGASVGASALLLGAAAVALLPLVRERRTPGDRDRGGAAGGLFAGFGHLARTPHPRVVAVLYLTHTLALGGLTVLVVVLALDALGLDDAGVGLLTAAMGAGGVAGSFAALGLVGHPRLARALAVGVLVWGLATGVLGLAPHAAAAAALLAATGLCGALVDVAALTLLQRLVPEALLGRVLGVVEGVWWGTFGIGGFLASLVAGAFGVRVTLGVVGGALALLTVTLHGALRTVDASAVVPAHHLEPLLHDRILAPLPTTEIERLALAAVPLTAAAGEAVVRTGEVGDRYYVIAAGAVEVSRPGLRKRLAAGDGFGEVALLEDVPRTATVIAVEPTELLAIDRDAFLAAVRGHRRSAASAAAVVSERYGSHRTDRS